MDDEAVRSRVRTLAGAMAPEPRGPVSPGDRIVDDLGYDSLFIMALLSEIFDEFSLDLPDFEDFEALEDVSTIGTLEEVILRKVGLVHRAEGDDRA